MRRTKLLAGTFFFGVLTFRVRIPQPSFKNFAEAGREKGRFSMRRLKLLDGTFWRFDVSGSNLAAANLRTSPKQDGKKRAIQHDQKCDQILLIAALFIYGVRGANLPREDGVHHKIRAANASFI